jgi:ankyrin repeat protein
MGFKVIWYLMLEFFASFDYVFLSTVADTVILPITILETCCTGGLANAAAQGDLELVQRLLEAGADVNDRDSWGHTPLMSACWGGHKDIVQILLERGADVNAKTRRDWTAIRFAKKVGHPEIVALLKAAGAEEEPDPEDEAG